MAIHNYRNMAETGHPLLVMVKKGVGNYQKLKSDNTVTDPELSGGRVSLQDEYCHKSESERK